ncbi:MAG: 5-(carboxyamino)imidazole ribonucleotide synthase [Sphingomonadaceae bacterium]|nr:5-(carboxyamino)imidazole ribonucleotide synthase [Sphingomonadaceae bacterium]
MIAPGAAIGVLGGGQLGRMLAMAAAKLGYATQIYDPAPDACAAPVSARHVCAAWDDAAALAEFARGVSVVTYEFENVPVPTVEHLAKLVPVRPGANALEVAQDRLAEKRFAAAHGLAAPRFVPVAAPAALETALALTGTPAILKTRREGYDGKGQARIATTADAAKAWERLGGAPCILEAQVSFDAEFSVLVVRGQDGTTALWDSPENVHEGGTLRTSTVPAGDAVARHWAAASAQARALADALGYVGVLAVEFFACADGPLFNEMAPRVHNSGHWTIEGAETSQFENHIRAVCGLPLGSTASRGPAAMANLIGGEVDGWLGLFSDGSASVHIYGKGEPRPGRKMGHVTRMGRTA